MVSLDETGALGANQGQTISRAAAVLRALARGNQGRRLTDIAAETGLTKPTVLRLLRALKGEGFAFIDTAGAWRLGLGLVALGAAAANREGLRQLAADALARLAARTEDTVFFSLREGAEIMCVDRQEGPYPIRTLLLGPGQRRPFGSARPEWPCWRSSRARSRGRIGEPRPASARMAGTFTSELLRKRIAKARKAGYALNDGQIMSAMWAVGVPVRDGAGQVVAALSIAAITERMQRPRLDEIVALLRAEAEAIEHQFRIEGDAAVGRPRIGPAVRASRRAAGDGCAAEPDDDGRVQTQTARGEQ